MQTETTAALLTPFPDVATAARAALDLLYWRLGFGLWVVTVVDGEHHRILACHDRRYGVREGAWYPWLDRYCWALARAGAPRVAWDLAATPASAGFAVEPAAPVRALLGAPLLRADGAVAGVLGGFDPLPQTDALRAERPLLDLLARLFGSLLACERSSIA